jgi:hypothetical protein
VIPVDITFGFNADRGRFRGGGGFVGIVTGFVVEPST